MNFAVKSALIDRANERRTGISDAKGPEYTGEASSYKDGGDILRNFYVRAERGKCSVFTVAQTYSGKHIDSIETTLAQLAQADTITKRLGIVNQGEGLLSRLDDLRNYCDLLECILMEEGIHPEKIDKQKVGDVELLEAAARMDWRTPSKVNDQVFGPSDSITAEVGQASREAEKVTFRTPRAACALRGWEMAGMCGGDDCRDGCCHAP